MLLSLVAGAASALGLDYGYQHIQVALCDRSGEPGVDDYSPAEVEQAPSESLDPAERLVHKALHGAGVTPIGWFGEWNGGIGGRWRTSAKRMPPMLAAISFAALTRCAPCGSERRRVRACRHPGGRASDL